MYEYGCKENGRTQINVTRLVGMSLKGKSSGGSSAETASLPYDGRVRFADR